MIFFNDLFMIYLFIYLYQTPEPTLTFIQTLQP